MDFARKILGKYGWKDGDGLGKNNTGIAKPLRATLKFDNAGFGADQAASDFNNHWWERVFNDAASNVDVKQDGDTIKMDLKNDEDGVEISTKGYSMKKLKKAKANKESSNISATAYNNFMQAATLTNLGGEIENPNRIEAGDIEVTKVKVLTDEELFKACGGRTAHKGARHGLKLSGKLARIEQQEQELLAKMMARQNGSNEATKDIAKPPQKSKHEIENQEDEVDTGTKKKKKKRKQISEENIPEQNESDNTPTIEGEDEKACESMEISKAKQKKKKRKHENVETSEIPIQTQEVEVPKTKKKKKSKTIEEESNVVDQIHKKKKSKNKSKSSEE